MSLLPSHSDFTEIITYLICCFPYLIARFKSHAFSFLPLVFFFSLTVPVASKSGMRFFRKANVAVLIHDLDKVKSRRAFSR